MAERRLFERLVAPEADESRQRAEDVRALTDSVIKHLSRLMNSRHGCAQTRSDYGIPDLNEFVFDFPDTLGSMRQAIQQAIETFEPRLTSVRAQFESDPDNPLQIKFAITARLVTKNRTMPIKLISRTGGETGFEIAE